MTTITTTTNSMCSSSSLLGGDDPATNNDSPSNGNARHLSSLAMNNGDDDDYSKRSDQSSSQSSSVEKYATICRKKNTTNAQFLSISTLGRQSARFERLTLRKKCDWLKSNTNSGFIRLFAPTGSRSVIYPVTLETSVQDICSILGFEGLYLQIGGLRIVNLSTGVFPLRVQNEILTRIGYETGSECMMMGDATHITHIFCFYMGRPQNANSIGGSNEILIASCYVRKGRLLQKWIRRRCILYNGTIRIEHDGEDDEIILISRYRAEVCDGGSRGKYLRLLEFAHVYCFQFDAIGEMNLWLSRVMQVRSPPVGWLDDIHRFSALRSLNLADNSLGQFPLAVLSLINLNELTLSGNRLPYIPSQIGDLINLTTLNLNNNWLKALPEELSQCTMISKLDLSFNRFKQIPDVLFSLRRLLEMQLAGNDITVPSLHALSSVHLHKFDLRRNSLKRTIRLTSFICDALTELDFRDNMYLSQVDLSNLPNIQVVHCERLQLTSLQINGTSLKYLNADYNDLSQVIIMPIPIHLIVFSVSHNNFTTLPEWLTELPRIETISANHNCIRYLPYRIFMNVSSLRSLILNNNDLERLPELIENCAIEVLTLHNNRIDELPDCLLKTAHKLRDLNVSNNRLSRLPAANTMRDLNKLQYLRAAGNHLTESIVSTIVSCRRLRLLDLSYNQLRFFDDSCLYRLSALEEVNLSANRLTSISQAFGSLPNLRILRVHSNLLTQLPNLSQSPSLFLLDISNNEFDNLDTDLCMAKTLKHLDLTCNNMLQVDASNIKPKKKGRAVSVVEVDAECERSMFQFGFCETAGQKSRLCIQQIRPKHSSQPIFGLIDGGNNDQIPALIAEKINEYLQKQLLLNTKILKMGLLYAHEHLGQLGQRLGASALLLYLNLSQQKLLCATTGHVRAVLCRRGIAVEITGQMHALSDEDYSQLRMSNFTITQDNLIDGICHCTRSLGFAFLYPAVVPNPVKIEFALQPGDEFIVIASRYLWQYLPPQQAIDTIRANNNPQIAAKKLQDTVQSFEFAGNLSVIVVRLKQIQAINHENVNTKDKIEGDQESVSSHVESSKHDETILRNIEERLEQISEAISKIEDDSNNNRSLSCDLDLVSADSCSKRSVRSHKCRDVEKQRATPNSSSALQMCTPPEVSACTSRAASSASAPPDPHTCCDSIIQPAATIDDAIRSYSTDRFSILSRIQLFDQRASDIAHHRHHHQQQHQQQQSLANDDAATRTATLTMTSRERFRRAKVMLGEQLRMETPENRIIRH